MAGRRARVLVLLSSSVVAVATAVVPLSASAAAASCTSQDTPLLAQVQPTSRSSFLTTSAAEAAQVRSAGFTESHGTLAKVSTSAGAGLVAVHRMYRKSSGDYLWTSSPSEVASATARYGYQDQGTQFYVAGSSHSCLVAVHRFYARGQHRMAVSTVERQQLSDAGWKDEGVKMYAAPASAAAAPAPGDDGDTSFSIAVMPDTQQEVLRSNDARFVHRSRWLVRNRSALNLKFVAHSGDVVNWDTPDHSQYAIASAALKPLETAGIPYSLAVGNHDSEATGVGGAARDPRHTKKLFRDTTTFNSYFTADEYGAVAGEYESGKVDNNYSTFSAGGEKWLVLTLEMWPRAGAVAWARQVVAAHADTNVIVVTHYFLDPDGSIAGTSSGYGATSPQYLFDHLIKVYPNIKLVFSGHVGGTANRVDTGVNGNKIYSFLETLHDNRTNPVRLVRIDTAAGTLKTSVYAPDTDETYRDSTRSFSGISWVR